MISTRALIGWLLNEFIIQSQRMAVNRWNLRWSRDCVKSNQLLSKRRVIVLPDENLTIINKVIEFWIFWQNLEKIQKFDRSACLCIVYDSNIGFEPFLIGSTFWVHSPKSWESLVEDLSPYSASKRQSSGTDCWRKWMKMKTFQWLDYPLTKIAGKWPVLATNCSWSGSLSVVAHPKGTRTFLRPNLLLQWLCLEVPVTQWPSLLLASYTLIIHLELARV